MTQWLIYGMIVGAALLCVGVLVGRVLPAVNPQLLTYETPLTSAFGAAAVDRRSQPRNGPLDQSQESGVASPRSWNFCRSMASANAKVSIRRSVIRQLSLAPPRCWLGNRIARSACAAGSHRRD